MGDAAVTVRVAGFSKRYGNRVAMRELGFSLGPGEIYGLIGPDGAGKTSVMKAVAGVLTYDGGTVDVLGVRIDSERAAERVKGRIGFMPQGLGANLYRELSIEENVDFFARLRGVSARDLATRKRRLLGMTRLDRFADRPVKHLSGGMKQKLGLVCTLVHEPELVILDEPTTGVDPVSRREFWAILGELLTERGVSALVSTAYLDEASRFHRVSVLDSGRELASGDPCELARLVPGTLVVASVAETDQVRALDRLRAEFAQVDALGPSLRVFIDQADAPGAEARVRGALEGLGEHRATVRAGEPELEDIVIALLRATGVDPRSGRGDAAPAPAGHPSDRTPRRARAQSTTPPVQATGLTRDFDGFRAVDEVTFDIRHGEIVGLLGANGAGKTTVIKMLTGILRPSSGTGQVAGVDIRRAGSAIKQRIGYMSQAFSLYTDLTVRENIELYAGIYGLDRRATRERVGALGALGGLAEHMAVPAGRLPMGLRQRLALGCALVHRPEVIFLDEPTSGVDPVGRRQFWDILFRLSREDRVAILVTTHYMNEAEHCDRLALMYAGRIVANASPEQLKRDVEHEAGELVEIALDAPARAIPVLADAGFDPVVFGRHVHVLAQDPARDIPRARAALDHADVRVRSIAQRPLSMEDVFVYRVTALERHGVRGAAS